MRIFIAVTAALLYASAAGAQQIQFGSGAGFNAVTPSVGLGLHAELHLEAKPRSGPFVFRVEGIFQQQNVRELFSFADIRLAPFRGAVAPYAITGYGAYFDNGPHAAWNAGVGMDVNATGPVPMFVEYRVLFARRDYSNVSVGFRIPGRGRN